MTLMWQHRICALLVAVGIHAGLGIALNWRKDAPVTTGAGTGTHGMEIFIGSTSAAAGSADSMEPAATAKPPPTKPHHVPQRAPNAPTPPRKQPEKPVEPDTSIKAEDIPVAPPRTSPAAVSPALHALVQNHAEQLEPDAEIAGSPVPSPLEHKPVPEPQSETMPLPSPDQTASITPPPPRRQSQVIPPDPAPIAEDMEQPENKPPGQQASASVAGAGGVSGSAETGSQETELASLGPSGAPGAAAADYYTLIRGWLEKHKEYPRRAKRRRQQGTAMLFFVLSRDGSILKYRIDRSSGFRILDGEVEAMLHRAQPLPPIPGTFQENQLELVIPIEFSIR